jgi:hypothetical protein
MVFLSCTRSFFNTATLIASVSISTPKQLIFEWAFCCMPTVHSSLYMWRRKGIYIYMYILMYVLMYTRWPLCHWPKYIKPCREGPHGLWVLKKKTFYMNFPHVMWKATHQGQYDEETLIGWNDSNVIGQSTKQVWMWPLIDSSYELECWIAPSIKVWQC